MKTTGIDYGNMNYSVRESDVDFYITCLRLFYESLRLFCGKRKGCSFFENLN